MLCAVALESQVAPGALYRLINSASAPDPCSYYEWPIDQVTNYVNLTPLDGLNEGCHWSGPYVAHTYENVPAIWHQDFFTEYADGAGTNGWNITGLDKGIAWYTEYSAHTYEDNPLRRYQDRFAEYTDAQSMIINTLAGGTNYFNQYLTNSVTSQSWTNGAYVGKGY